MTNEKDIKAYLNELQNIDKDISMAHGEFTNKVCELLDITKEDLKSIAYEHPLRIYLTKEKIYLIPSNQHLTGWNTFFHITRQHVDIHNISSQDALDLHKSSGTGSYSFTKDEVLINRIYKAIEKKEYTIKKRKKWA